MIVADSCYSGNLTRVATSTVRSGAERSAWMERMNQKRSRTALTSGGLEPVLDRGGGDHSVFAWAFLSALEENPDVLFGEELFDRLKGQVVANADQTPEYSDIRYTGHEKGDFLFVPLDIDVSVTVQIPPTGQADREALFWQSIQNSDDPAMFEAYLKRYSAGEFADIAKLKIKAIAKAKEQQTARVVPPRPEIEIDPIEAEYVAVKNTNVRAEPTVRSAEVATLKRGTTVQVAGKVKGGNWYLVERDDKPLGYVYGELLMQPEAAKLALAPPPTSATQPAVGSTPSRSGETPPPPEPQTYVARTRVWVYRKPTTKVARTGEFFVEAESFKVTEVLDDGRWLKVITRSGKSGYVYGGQAYKKGDKTPGSVLMNPGQEPTQ